MINLLFLFLLIQPQFNLSSGIRKSRDVSYASDDSPSWEFLNDPQCGLTNSDRIIGGEKAGLGAYPWLAMLGYVNKRNPQNIDFRCGASVISKWYILTAAHCLKTESFILKVIRLGEHNLNTNPDCEGGLFCNDPYREYNIAEIIVHENYDNPKLQNDIGLIKVDREIEFTEFIRPICIPQGTLFEKNLTGLTSEVAGWGIYDIANPKRSPYLLTVKLPILNMDRCTGYRRRNIPLASTQLCVGGEVGKDSCGGDSGGPLMRVDEDSVLPGPRYYLLGIVSFGATSCGATDLPAIYTRIVNFLPWILANMNS